MDNAKTNIRKIAPEDSAAVAEMMRVFYASPAVSTNGSEEIFKNDIAACFQKESGLSGFVFERGGNIAGYGMTSAGFSTEAGSRCVWIEDLYVKPEYRACGIGGLFLEFVKREAGGLPVKLEVETENEKAISVYKKHGFKALPYHVMKG